MFLLTSGPGQQTAGDVMSQVMFFVIPLCFILLIAVIFFGFKKLNSRLKKLEENSERLLSENEKKENHSLKQ